jgi:uncharacterized Zn finger protein
MKKKKDTYYAGKDGEWLGVLKSRGYMYVACCDCGLVHKMRFRVRDGQVQLMADRDERRTGQRRRHHFPNIKV